MNARIYIIGITLVQLLFYMFESIIIENQRKKPLPLEVSDIYDETRYQTYLQYAKDNRKLSIVIKIVSLCILCCLTFSNVYTWIDTNWGEHVYLTYFITYGLYFVVDLIPTYAFQYYDTFKIEEKYGMNKKDHKEFHRDFLLDQGSEIGLMMLLGVFIIFIGENLPIWTKFFTLSLFDTIVITTFVFACMILLVLLINFVSLWVLKTQYTFTPLEEGELKDKILALQEGVKRKVKHIYVYDESNKSTSKNAFLLRFLWIREFGIADNFLQENENRELLAVLSHEIGHLKHKKTILDYASYIFLLVLYACMVYLIYDPTLFIQFLMWIQDSFGIQYSNYYLIVIVCMNVITPVLFLFSLYRNYNIRTQEYEADNEAVKNGYGEALITTFKRLSNDELVNVNPSPIIEFLEYDHPGMYHRIKSIQDNMKKQ